MQKFYDTDILTDNPPSDLQSDKDLPKDKLFKKKQLMKDELRRVHKEIRISGQHYIKPAAYDEIFYRYTHITEEQYEDKDFDLRGAISQIEERMTNIGFPGKDEFWLDRVLQSMKKEEITIVIIEHLKYDGNNMKILDRNEYILIQVLRWTTIIDLYQDRTYMKRIEQRGRGNERCEQVDEIQFNYKISKGDQVIKTYNSNHVCSINLEDGTITRNIWKIMKTMKPGEKVICTIKNEQFVENEQESFLAELTKDLTPQNKDLDWIVEIHIEKMYKVDDLFGDGSIVKKSVRKGYSTAKPEKVSEIGFDLWIYKKSTQNLEFPSEEDILYQSVPRFPNFYKEQKPREDLAQKVRDEDREPEKLFDDTQEKQKKQVEPSLRLYIDDKNISKLLRRSLIRCKKQELAVFGCNDTAMFVQTGFDKQKIVEALGTVPTEIVYVLKVYDFTEGKNNFTMTVAEKIEQAKRKKTIGLDYIRQQNYKKALKVFRTINAYFDYGTFTEDEKINMYEHQVSALLNTSLCQLKLKLWKDIIISTTKVLGLQPSSQKAIYRKATALKELGEYSQGLELIDEFLQSETQQQQTANKDDLLNEIRTLRSDISIKNQQYKSKEKQRYQKMFE